MSAFGDAFKAVRQVILLDDRMAKVQENVSRLQRDLDDLKRRVARIEGMIEMAMYTESRRLGRD